MTRSILEGVGVVTPTQAASSQWVLGKPSCERFHFVLPPLLVSSGSPRVCNRSKSDRRRLFTAAASERGAMSCFWMCRRVAGLSCKYSSIGAVAFLLVAAVTGGHTIARPVTAPAAAWEHVVQFQWHARHATIGAGVVPLSEHVLTQLTSGEHPELVVLACQFGLL